MALSVNQLSGFGGDSRQIYLAGYSTASMENNVPNPAVLTVPPGGQDGDLLALFVVTDDALISGTPSGYTVVTNSTSGSTCMYSYARSYVSPEASVEIPSNKPGGQWLCAILCLVKNRKTGSTNFNKDNIASGTTTLVSPIIMDEAGPVPGLLLYFAATGGGQTPSATPSGYDFVVSVYTDALPANFGAHLATKYGSFTSGETQTAGWTFAGSARCGSVLLSSINVL